MICKLITSFIIRASYDAHNWKFHIHPKVKIQVSITMFIMSMNKNPKLIHLLLKQKTYSVQQRMCAAAGESGTSMRCASLLTGVQRRSGTRPGGERDPGGRSDAYFSEPCICPQQIPLEWWKSNRHRYRKRKRSRLSPE